MRWVGSHARCELPVGYIRQISGMNHLIQYLRIRVMIAVGEQALCVQCAMCALTCNCCKRRGKAHTHVCIRVHCTLCIVHYRLCIVRALCIVCVQCTLCIVHCLCIMQVAICNGPRVHQHQIGSRRASLLCISRSLLPLTLAPQCLQCNDMAQCFTLVCNSRSHLALTLVPQCLQCTNVVECFTLVCIIRSLLTPTLVPQCLQFTETGYNLHTAVMICARCFTFVCIIRSHNKYKVL